jgi:hypothetical protein
MQDSEHLICVLHIPNPGVPPAVCQPYPETCEHENHRKNGVGRVDADYYVGDNFARWSNDRYAKLTEAHVYCVVEERGECVAEKGSQKDE